MARDGKFITVDHVLYKHENSPVGGDHTGYLAYSP